MGTERAVETTPTPAWAAAPTARTPWWRPWRLKRANPRGMAGLTATRVSSQAMPLAGVPVASCGQPTADDGDQDAFLKRLRQAGL